MDLSNYSRSLGGRPYSDSAPSRVQHALNGIVDHIRAQGLRVGDDLPGEQQFAHDLGVSRTVVREAIGALAALNLVDVGNGRRPRVGAADVSFMSLSLAHAIGTAQVSFKDVWDFRRGIELHAAALAASRRTEEEAYRISFLARRMSDAGGDLSVRVGLDIEFHLAIAAASHNILLAQVVDSFSPLMKQAVPLAWRTRKTRNDINSILEKHLAVAEAITNGDPTAAMHAMDEHFDKTIESLVMANELTGHGD